MSEFIAQVRAELDAASLSAIQKQLESIGKKGDLKLRVDTGNTADSVNKVSSSITTAKKNAQSFGDTLKHAFGIGSTAAVTLTAFREIEKAAGKAVDSVKDFDAAIADVRTVTGASYDSAAQMVKGYNDFGKALGATTNEVSQSAVTWLRQGKSAQQANVLIRDSMMLSKIGMLDSEQAATYLTSAMNGYKISVEDAVTVVDKLGKLDSSAAVTAGGLAEAMSRTANIASDAGISIDRLLGYLATMGEVTQLDMGSIGNSMKTILSRMSAIKAGKLSLIDEDGTVESLSDVETTLNSVGIRLRDSDNEFRNFGDVLDETAAKWNDLSTTQQAAVAQSFAGTRMQNNFRVLMNNYDKATQYMNTAANSAGTAEQKFGAYLDSLEAKSKTLQATFEGLAVNTLDTGFVADIIDASTAIIKLVDDTNLLKGAIAGLGAAGAIAGFTAFTNGIRTAVQHLSSFDAALKMLKAGNIGTAEIETLAQMTAGLSKSQLKAVLSSEALTTAQRLQILQMHGLSEAEAAAQLETMGLATAQGTATAATTTLGGAIKGLWATLKANPLILVVTAITAVVSAYNTYKQKQEEARQAALDAGRTALDEAEKIRTLYDAYNQAKQGLFGDKDVLRRPKGR